MSDKKPNQVADFFNNQTVAVLVGLLIPWLLGFISKKLFKPLQMLNWSEVILISLSISVSLFLQWFFVTRYLRQKLKDFADDQQSEENRKALLGYYDGSHGFSEQQLQYLAEFERLKTEVQPMLDDWNKQQAIKRANDKHWS